jgi:presenilin 1
MLLVVLLVSTLTSSTTTTDQIRTAANLVYLETPTDSAAEKLEGSLLNALVFVIIIAIVTFILVILYYYNFTNFLKNYMRFYVFFVLGSTGGSIFLNIIQHFNIPIDSITCLILLFNFCIVGALSVFAQGIPILVRQSYMVVLGIIVAAWFTKLPEWTTWAILVALALYDLVAVLAPGGPLRILLELASTRDDEVPSLYYEARPTVSQSSDLNLLVAGVSDSGSVELQTLTSINVQNDEIEVLGEEERETTPLVSPSPFVEILNTREVTEDSDLGYGTRGINLGVGDFVFYSVLVGRAAMYDLMTVYACYLAIISGLGCTLILLSVFRHPLPALPISIALGFMFYFLTRLLMEPFVVGMSTNLMMF